MKVTLHLTDHGLQGWSTLLSKWCQLYHGTPLMHVAVQVGDVVLDSSPARGSSFVPAAAWLRAARPVRSHIVGEISDFDWRDHVDLEGQTINPWLIAWCDLWRKPCTNCVTVSRQLLNALGFNVPEVRLPVDLADWTSNEEQERPTSG